MTLLNETLGRELVRCENVLVYVIRRPSQVNGNTVNMTSIGQREPRKVDFVPLTDCLALVCLSKPSLFARLMLVKEGLVAMTWSFDVATCFTPTLPSVALDRALTRPCSRLKGSNVSIYYFYQQHTVV
jgi:hypothetical protein